MGKDSKLNSLDGLVDSIHEMNRQIKQIDWNKKFNTDYPETIESLNATKNMDKIENRNFLETIFDEGSLALSELKRVSQ